MVNILVVILALIVLYVIMHFLLKISRIIIIAVIAILLLGFIFFGYDNTNEIFNFPNDPSEIIDDTPEDNIEVVIVTNDSSLNLNSSVDSNNTT